MVEHARFSHGNSLIFKDVGFDVQPGETLCLLGPNGCGKTTLVDCLLGINALEKGRILIDGDTLQTLSPKQIAKRIAYVPQKHVGHFSFSVLDVLLMGRTPYMPFYDSPTASDIQKAEAVLESMGLIRLRDRDYTHLSGGEAQLVLIMRALVQETPVIVMDEPTAHLDFKHELLVLETIVRLVRERGLTLVMATHFPNHAFFLENSGIPVTVAFMNSGQVHMSGSPSRALTQESIQRFYGIKSIVATHTIPEMGMLKQVIPLQTLDAPFSTHKKE